MTQTANEKENYFAATRLFARTREGRDPAWLENLRERANDSFAALDFPTTRDEAWKYTNVASIMRTPFSQVFALGEHGLTEESIAPFSLEESRGSRLVFINGVCAPELSRLDAEFCGLLVSNLADGPPEFQKLMAEHLGVYADYREQVFTSLNTALLGDGAFVHIPADCQVDRPLHLLFLSTTHEPVVAHPRTLIVAGRNSRATVIESYVSLGEQVYFNNAVTEVVVLENAQLNHYRLQEESERAYHIGTTHIHQERDSRYTSISIMLGAAISRHDLTVTLTDENIETTIDGLYVVAGTQHTDSHTVIDHQKPHCKSFQLYKGILDDRSRAVFNGKVFVRPGALLTDARQLNKNLLLSPEAHVDTKPELEIFADDVKCSHGATVGQLEPEELFYLASRGLSPEKARSLLTFGFAEDVISKIELDPIRKSLDRIVLDKLHQILEVI